MTWLFSLVGLCACTMVGTPPPQPPVAQAEPPAPVDPARAAWAEKQSAFDHQFADELAAFHALKPRLADPAAIAEADALRARFVKRCVAESPLSTVACWNATFARDITEALAKSRLAAGDKVGAYVESYSLYSYPDLRGDDAKLAAIRSGVDDEPANVRAPDELRSLEEQMQFVGETVRAVQRGKTTATIKFETRESSTTGYACDDPQLVLVEDRTTASGSRIAAKQKCVVSSQKVDRQTFGSVTVPLDEVDGLAVGQRANVVYAGKQRKGHVLDSWPDTYTKTYLTFRTTRMKKAQAGYP